jgi:hypothetical protein
VNGATAAATTSKSARIPGQKHRDAENAKGGRYIGNSNNNDRQKSVAAGKPTKR